MQKLNMNIEFMHFVSGTTSCTLFLEFLSTFWL